MEENKYYTPSIDEFYIGFEYEYYSNGNWSISNDFVDVFSDWDTESIYSVKSEIQDKTIRVKYLDQKDIESLGFTELFKEIKYFNLRHFNLFFFEDSNIISIDKMMLGVSGAWSEVMIFRGIIKNKSELKFIMKCLEIKNGRN